MAGPTETRGMARPAEATRTTPGTSPAAVALTGLTALAVAVGIGRFAFTPILPLMQQDAGLSVAQGGWLASANYLGYLVGALSAMGLRVRPATATRVGLVLIGLATLGMGLEHRFAAWVALRWLAGVGSAWVLVFASAWCLERLAPARRPLLNGAVFAGVGTGIAVAGGACLVLMQAGASSAQAWTSLGVLSLAGTAVIWRAFGADADAGVSEGRPVTARMGRPDRGPPACRGRLPIPAFPRLDAGPHSRSPDNPVPSGSASRSDPMARRTDVQPQLFFLDADGPLITFRARPVSRRPDPDGVATASHDGPRNPLLDRLEPPRRAPAVDADP